MLIELSPNFTFATAILDKVFHLHKLPFPYVQSRRITCSQSYRVRVSTMGTNAQRAQSLGCDMYFLGAAFHCVLKPGFGMA